MGENSKQSWCEISELLKMQSATSVILFRASLPLYFPICPLSLNLLVSSPVAVCNVNWEIQNLFINSLFAWVPVAIHIRHVPFTHASLRKIVYGGQNMHGNSAYSKSKFHHTYFKKWKWIIKRSNSFSVFFSTLSSRFIIILSCHQHGYPWPSLAILPYYSLLLAGLQGYIPYPHRAAVCRVELVALLLFGHGRTTLMISSLLLQQSPACLVHLTSFPDGL